MLPNCRLIFLTTLILTSGCNFSELSGSGSSSSSNEASAPTVTPTPSPLVSLTPSSLSTKADWTLLDGGSVNTPGTAVAVSLASFNSKIYGIWQERIGEAWRMTVGVFNSKGKPNYWNKISGANGLNINPNVNGFPGQLAVANSKLYAIWSEMNSTPQIHVALYNGDDSNPSWSIVDGGSTGLNYNSTMSSFRPALAAFNSKLYATWDENFGYAHQVRVAVYNGNDSSPGWHFVDGGSSTGLNMNTANSATTPHLIEFNSKLYLIWSECSIAYSCNGFEIRVKVYNGNDASPSWKLVDAGSATAGLNINPNLQGTGPRLSIFNSKLYASWSETTNSGVSLLHIKVYNGDDNSPAWSLVDGTSNGLNVDQRLDAVDATFTEYDSKLYGFWLEVAWGMLSNLHVKVYNGNDLTPSWSSVSSDSTVLNCPGGQGRDSGQIFQFNNQLYAAWAEECPKDLTIRFAQYGLTLKKE